MEAGLINKWASDYRFKEKFVYEGVKITTLKIAHIIGILYMLISFFIFTIIIFGLEQIIHKFANRDHSHRYWKLASKLIDGDRHLFNSITLP